MPHRLQPLKRMAAMPWHKAFQDYLTAPFTAHILALTWLNLSVIHTRRKNPESGMPLAMWGLKTNLLKSKRWGYMPGKRTISPCYGEGLISDISRRNLEKLGFSASRAPHGTKKALSGLKSSRHQFTTPTICFSTSQTA